MVYDKGGGGISFAIVGIYGSATGFKDRHRIFKGKVSINSNVVSYEKKSNNDMTKRRLKSKNKKIKTKISPNMLDIARDIC